MSTATGTEREVPKSLEERITPHEIEELLDGYRRLLTLPDLHQGTRHHGSLPTRYTSKIADILLLLENRLWIDEATRVRLTSEIKKSICSENRIHWAVQALRKQRGKNEPHALFYLIWEMWVNLKARKRTGAYTLLASFLNERKILNKTLQEWKPEDVKRVIRRIKRKSERADLRRSVVAMLDNSASKDVKSLWSGASPAQGIAPQPQDKEEGEGQASKVIELRQSYPEQMRPVLESIVEILAYGTQEQKGALTATIGALQQAVWLARDTGAQREEER
ncbi:MAG TPA: hypothetical protein VMT71_13840 [Syntrophorhabdales bacterium]|nr:hypothetical protein [Syntrophorhabdales bacterium]